MAKCCPETPEIDGIYKPLSRRLVDFGNEVYADCSADQRVIMWVFSFYNAKDECPVCKHGIESMYNWFGKHGLLENPARGVRIVIDDEASTSAILDDIHVDFAPVCMFTDGEGKVIDMIFEFPDDAWLEKYILPFIQKDMSII